MSKVELVKGIIETDDGQVREFMIDGSTGDYSQWGNVPERLGETVDVVDAMVEGLVEHELLSYENPFDIGDATTTGGRR